MDDQRTTGADSRGQLVLWTLLAGIPSTILGLGLLVMWGSAAQAGHHSFWLKLAGVVGFVLLLPTMLLGYLNEAVGGLGMTVESILIVVGQFFGYYALVYGIHQLRENGYKLSLRAMLITITVAALVLSIIAWGGNF